MRVKEVLIENNNKRYILLNQEGFPVMPAMKEIMNWIKVNYQGKEVARWKMKTTELFKTYLEI
ncbi:hypothetical protein KAF80_14265 [Bacillus sp. WL1]|uniref:tubby C-terminal domain-like protein n=1 Tax=unclassified Bacillus (in: firmicutes) TaxID=185979 RepID=UPI001B345081|nr:MULTISPECIES: hypothetical protein [unclassified Bacillus (in: firmicutes)]MBP3970202.1 hypothetical protein [Bacillus sp. WL1]UOB81700.1 hypothetical protein MQW34_16955 [Bacillus sp. ZJS3]